jgi:hypothetical protein
VHSNGREAAARLVADAKIELEDGSEIRFDRSLVVREGALGSTALSRIPALRDFVPLRMLQVTECKWRSRARLWRPGRAAVDGWAIHERVEWPG